MANLLDEIIKRFGLKNDAALARKANLSPPVVSKMRHEKISLSATIVLALHEAFDMPVQEIKSLAGANELAEN